MRLHSSNEQPRATSGELSAARLPLASERLAAEIVAAHVRRMFADADGCCATASAFEKLRPSYRRWSIATLEYLQRQNLAKALPEGRGAKLAETESIDVIWQRWDAMTQEWQGNANHRAYLGLIEACLRRLPDILAGDIPATDVMFPESSMHMVEGIYKHNIVADHFNQVLSECLRTSIAEKIAGGERGIRLLEIGAGTGGTTAALLPMLREFGEAIVEYRYTDLSKAFLLHAEETYKPYLPAIETAIFDVSKPLRGQDVSADRYDAVIATNVLHATPNMRETMRNAKAALKRNGLLLVNEISDWSWYTHFTFGLLEGWWLYEDDNLRLPGSPALSPAQWGSLLKNERYFNIQFPAKAHHDLGQQIILATSDGVVRQRLVSKAAPEKSSVQSSIPHAAPSATPRAETVASQHDIGDGLLRERCIALFRDLIAAALRMDPRELEPHKALENYGLDSILVVQLTTRFRKLFPAVRSTLFFEVQSIDGLVQHFLSSDRAALVSVVCAQDEAQHVSTPTRSESHDSALTVDARSGRRRFGQLKEAPIRFPQDHVIERSTHLARIVDDSDSVDANGGVSNVFDVAVIGLSGRYPQADDLDQFWDNLSSGRNCVTEIPADRWNWHDYYDPEKAKSGKSYTKWGGFLTDIDKFDPLFFKIAPKEAKRIDPQERLFLETTYHAIEDSGYTPATLAPSGKVGVFVGVMNSRYTIQPLYYSIANRVSFLFNFTGPSFAVDSACSSSLTAIHLALDSLYSGMCETAIAGGVSLIVDPQHMLELTAVGMLSEGSRCRSFGKNADGFVDAEGVGAVVLKPLSHAQRDRDNIYAVIKGSALNAGGRTHGYTVPSPTGQAEVVSSALIRANVDAADISYIEAHGTGTALGDPIEVSGLAKAFSLSDRVANSSRAQRQHCAIGSLKSNIGHCESAAGIAALSKVLLQIKYQKLVPTLHADEVNDEIDFSATPFRLQRDLAPWQRLIVDDVSGTREIPRTAGISSFGAGGANAHIVVQEYQASMSDANNLWIESDTTLIVPLSARTAEQLQIKVRQLQAFLTRHQSDVKLKDLAYTLQIGREAMDERLALITNSIDDLQGQLQSLTTHTRTENTCYRGSAKQEKAFIATCKADTSFPQRWSTWLSQSDNAKIAEHWARGLDVDWITQYSEMRPTRISLPLYPFARERHWIDPQRSKGNGLLPAISHPLLQRNTSTLRHPEFSSRFKGDESFMVQNREGRSILPSFLYIEMARAAIAAAYPEHSAHRCLYLTEFVCGNNFAVDAESELHIALLSDSDDALRLEIYETKNGLESVLSQCSVMLESRLESPPYDVASLSARLARGDSGASFYGRLDTLGIGGDLKHRAVQRFARYSGEIILELSLAESPTPESPASEQWSLSLQLLACLTQGAAWLLDEMGGAISHPVEWDVRELRTLSLQSRVEKHVYLIMRRIETAVADQHESEWDVELIDLAGQVCLRGTGMRFERLSPHAEPSGSAEDTSVPTRAITPPSATPRSIATATAQATRVEPAAWKQIAFSPATSVMPIVERVTAKPSSITLSAIKDIGEKFDLRGEERTAISLTELNVATTGSEQPSVIRIHAYNSGVFSIAIEHSLLDASLSNQLRQALQLIKQRSDAKVVLITGSGDDFLHGDRQSINLSIDSGLFDDLLALSIPTIAVMRGNASGAGFLFGALCDFTVCSHNARYGFLDFQCDSHPTTAESDFFAARFGEAWANDLLYIGGTQTGSSMRKKGWGMQIVDRDRAVPVAIELAENIASKSIDAIRLLKQHMACAWRDHVSRFDTSVNLREIDAAVRDQRRMSLSIGGHIDRIRVRDAVVVELLERFVVSLRIQDIGLGLKALLSGITASLNDLAQFTGIKALILRSDHGNFLPLSDEDCSSEFITLQGALSHFPAPVIAAYEQDANGLGWLFGLSGDVCVYRDIGLYSMNSLWQCSALLRQTTPLLHSRLGEYAAKAILLDANPIAGASLATYAAIVTTSGDGDAFAKAIEIAESTPLLSPDILRQWRIWQSTRLSNERAFSESHVDASASAAETRPSAPFVSISQCIETELHDNGVFVVRMVDRQAKNMFSDEIIRGLDDVFAHIEASSDYRAVVLSGYDTYFACGGTKESLLAIQQGKAKFTDAKIYQLPMSCKLPVVAAMQGHAIGGGWALGMFADICLFSAESHYVSPYTHYGFTPGAGSTLIFPATFGVDLANETLFTAIEYTGSELREKGMKHRCFPRSELMDQALAIANALASRDRDDMFALKSYFNGRWLSKLGETYERELAMHAKSFVGQQDALMGVMHHFLTDEVPAQIQSSIEPQAAAALASTDISSSIAISISTIAHELKNLLASELQMSSDEIDQDMQFIDLGLDSITGVTWVKKINSKYGIRIEATKVYSHPTLRQFVDFVYERIAMQASIAAPAHVEIVTAPHIASGKAPTAQKSASDAWSSSPASARPVLLADVCYELKKLLAQELHMAEADIDEDRQFVELGLDSITGVTWVRKINTLYGTKIEATKVYSYPTLDEFSRFLCEALPMQVSPQRESPRAAQALSPAAAPVHFDAPRRYANQRRMTSWRNQPTRYRGAVGHSSTDAIAIIGIAGQFPQSGNLDEFWQNIANGKDCIGQVPSKRWNIDEYFNEDISVPGTTNSRWMGTLDDCDAFDPLFFNISPAEAESMDPQQRLTLQTCWHAIENASIHPKSLSGTRCGVFVGCGATDYHQRSREHQYSTQGFTGASMSILAARISYFLNLQGPCLSIDTACSSSLVAIANACDSLASQDCVIALAGGVAVMAGPMMHVKTAQSGMLSPDGRCFAFDHRANGFVPGEGVGIVMLKRLADAERDGDIIHATIRGWGVNQDGKTNGITAPNPVSQTRLMRDIYDKFGIDPQDIQLIEAHGTGTKLGDPIEVEGLNEAFSHYTKNVGYCALGSVKSNIGHCLYAAGVAGVLKLVVALKQRQLPPSANFERLNQHIDLAGTPFFINTELKPWPENASGRRTAVVSSFGFSGTNAHLVLESYAKATAETTQGEGFTLPVLIPLSAKTKEQLLQKAQELADFIEKDTTSISLLDIAYTLQIGRDAMDERFATVARNKHEFVARLRAFATGDVPQDAYAGHASTGAIKLAFLEKDSDLREVLIEKCVRDGRYDKLAELWVDGFDLDWSKLYQHSRSSASRGRRIELPLYPFAKERYWLEDDMSVAAPFATITTTRIHPLLHVNASTLRRQRYRTTFQGDEFFLRDHRVRLADGKIHHVLPGVAYLEMAAAAVSDAVPERAATHRLVLRNVAWWRPVVANGTTSISIELSVDQTDEITFEIISEFVNESRLERIVHCQGEALFIDKSDAPRTDITFVKSALSRNAWSANEIYLAFTQVGLHYGPAHCGIENLSRSDGKIFAKIALPASATDHASYRLHPSIMDSALQACIGFLPSLQELPHEPSVPFALKALSIYSECPPETYVVLTPARVSNMSGVTDTCDVAIYAPNGRLCVQIHGFSWRTVEAKPALSVEAAPRIGATDKLPMLDEAFYEQLLESISNNEMTVEEAVELGLLS